MIFNGDDFSAVEFNLMVDPERWGEGAEEVLLTDVEVEARSRAILAIRSCTLPAQSLASNATP